MTTSKRGASNTLPGPLQTYTDDRGQFILALADADQATLRLESDTLGTMITPHIPVGTNSVEELVWEGDQGALEGRILRADATPAKRHFVHIAGQLHGKGTPVPVSTEPMPVIAEPTEAPQLQESIEIRPNEFYTPGVMPSGTSQTRRGGGGRSSQDESRERVVRRGEATTVSRPPSPQFGPGDPTPPPNFPQRPVESKGNFSMTDADGHFNVDALPIRGAYTVTLYNEAGRVVGVTTLPSLRSNQSTSWQFTLQQPLRVIGQVVGMPSGEGLEGIPVQRMLIRGTSGSPSQQASTKTGTDGRFELSFFDREGAYRFRATLDNSGFCTAESDAVELHLDRISEITLTLPDPWSRRFQVFGPYGDPVVGAQIRLETRTRDGGGYSGLLEDLSTDVNGRVLVPHLPPMVEARVGFEKAGYLESTSTWASGLGNRSSQAEKVILFPQASVSARVMDGNRQVLSNQPLICTVDSGDSTWRVVSVTTDADGWILLDGELPATEIDFTIRLPLQADSHSSRSTSSSTGLPPQLQAKRDAQRVQEAIDANTPSAYFGGISLGDGALYELGDVVLIQE